MKWRKTSQVVYSAPMPFIEARFDPPIEFDEMSELPDIVRGMFAHKHVQMKVLGEGKHEIVRTRGVSGVDMDIIVGESCACTILKIFTNLTDDTIDNISLKSLRSNGDSSLTYVEKNLADDNYLLNLVVCWADIV